MNEILKIVIYYAAIFTPYRLLCYIPFYKKLRFSLAVSIIIFTLANILHYLFIALFVLKGADVRSIEFISVLFGIPYFIIVKEDPFKLLFFYIFIMDTVIILRGISVFIMYTFFDVSYTAEILIHTVCFAVFLPFLIILLRKAVTIIFDVEAPKLWRTIWILPFVTSAIILMFTYDLKPAGSYRLQFISARLLFIFAVLMIYGVLLASLKNIKEQTILKEKSETANKLTAMYMTQYNTLYNHITEIKKARHDLRQHINLIQSYIDKGNNKALSEYLALYKKTIPDDIKTGYCANNTIDVMLGWYGALAEENNIKFITDIRVPSEINIPEPTLCVLFGNLLENAIDACKATDLEVPFIKVCCTITGTNVFSLTVDNSCKYPPVFENGVLMSSKHKGKGYGTYSVSSIAEEYGGIADFKYNNNVFYASVLLYTKHEM